MNSIEGGVGGPTALRTLKIRIFVSSRLIVTHHDFCGKSYTSLSLKCRKFRYKQLNNEV